MEQLTTKSAIKKPAIILKLFFKRNCFFTSKLKFKQQNKIITVLALPQGSRFPFQTWFTELQQK
ncbi:MAG: hypothetical protein CVU08_13600 [Bacteroidetes bacterium HGW-Bacteroidetes-3]|nr:MAG: hypothetical protein CVU08_13600 [Bacteroidetes bacterium HGW-Bacteroidetes-3]